MKKILYIAIAIMVSVLLLRARLSEKSRGKSAATCWETAE